MNDTESEAKKSEDSEPGQQKRLNPLQVAGSVLAASLGIQSSKNRERDFKEGSFGTFIVAGIVFTALFIGTLYLVVTTVLENAR